AVGRQHRLQVVQQLEVLPEPEAVGAEQVLGGLGGVDHHPVHRHQEVDRHDRQDRGDDDGRGGFAARLPGARTAVGDGGSSRPGGTGARSVGAGGVLGVGGVHRRFSVREETPSATAERVKAATAMITACAAAMPMSSYWDANAKADRFGVYYEVIHPHIVLSSRGAANSCS